MLKFSLVTPIRQIVDMLELESLIVPGHRGDLEILNNHAPLVTTLKTGTISYKLKGDPEIFNVAVSWGYCEVFPGGVNVIAETAEISSEIDIKRAEVALNNASSKLADDITPEQSIKYQRKLRRAETRIKVSK